MKRLTIISAVFFLSSMFVIQNTHAQVTGQDTDLSKDYVLDFTVPDAPAFKLIDVDESAILRPTSVRELGIGFSDFTGGDNSLVTIPRAFAVEFSPALLIKGKTLTLKDYQAKPWLYRLRVSGATKRLQGERGPSQIAFGLRLSLIDKSDLRTDKKYLRDAGTITEKINDIYTSARERIGPPPAPIILLPDEQKTADELSKILKDNWAEDNWNEEILDIAFALRAMSSDSLGKNLEMEEYSFWLTYGRGFLKKGKGQWLLGQNAGVKRDTTDGDFKLDFSIASRIYIGTNNFKGFIEAQASKMEGNDHEILFNSGAEATLGKSTWIVFSAGMERNGETKKWDIVSNFKFKMGLPGAN